MKTYYLFNQKRVAFTSIWVIMIFLNSCGSYQNVSYYDNDGVYGTTRPTEPVVNKYSEQNMESSNVYSQRFRAMQDDFGYFTDVDNYNSQNQDTVVTVYNNEYDNQNYAGWGNNATSVSINYYDNWGWNNWYSPYWGTGWNWGWNSWYGPNWGWGWNSWYGPNWGWGWNSWYGPGWNSWYGNNWGWNGYYGRDVVYNRGRRGGNGYYNIGNRRNDDFNYNDIRTNRNYSNNRGNTTTRNNFSPRRNQNIVTPRNSSTQPRNYTPRNQAPRENNYTPRNQAPRENNYTPRNQAPRENNHTPRNNNYSSPRSSSGGGFGGGRSGGSSGGGRSGGGGRGGRG